MSNSVFGIANNVYHAETILERLQFAGFPVSDISVMHSGDERPIAVDKETKAPEGATTGAGTGGVVGGALGLLAGLGLVAIPGLGALIAAGPLVAALSGAAVGAGVGGVAGALIGLGLPEYEAKRYNKRLEGGNVLIAVHCETDEAEDQACQVMEAAGAEDISRAKEHTSV